MSIALGVNAIWHESTDPEILRRIKDELGPRVYLVRADLQFCDPQNAGRIAGEVVDAGLQPFCVIRQAAQVEYLPNGSLVSHFNEADITANGWEWTRDVDQMFDIIEACDRRGLKCYVGGAVSNPHNRGRRFLSSLPWDLVPPHIGVDIHRYVHQGNPRNPQQGCKSREDEVAKVRSIVDRGAPRPLAVSEVGYSNTEFTDEAAYQFLLFEVDFWESQGADALIAYQIADGDDREDRDENYGFLRYDPAKPVREWEWKPQARAFAGYT